MIMLKLLRFRSGNSFLFNSPSNFGVLIRKPVQDQSTTLNACAKMWSLSLVPKRSSFFFFFLFFPMSRQELPFCFYATLYSPLLACSLSSPTPTYKYVSGYVRREGLWYSKNDSIGAWFGCADAGSNRSHLFVPPICQRVLSLQEVWQKKCRHLTHRPNVLSSGLS